MVRCTSTLIIAMAYDLLGNVPSPVRSAPAPRCGMIGGHQSPVMTILSGRAVLRFWEIPSRSSTRGLGRTFQKESLPECLFSRRREVDHTRALRASRPAELEATIEQRSAQRAGKMMTAHTPTQTCATQRVTSAHQRFDVDPDPG